MLNRLKKPFTYWVDLYREIRIWSVFRKTANQNKKMLSDKHGLRVDWLGRIYGVINLPQEVESAAEQVQQAYTLQQITKFGQLMLELGVADIVYPEIEKIKGSPAYLIVMWPEYEALNIWYLIGNLIRTAIIGAIFYLLARLIWVNFDYVSTWLTTTFDLVKDLF